MGVSFLTVNVDRGYVSRSFETDKQPFALGFFGNSDRLAVTAYHFILFFVCIVKRKDAHSMRKTNRLACSFAGDEGISAFGSELPSVIERDHCKAPVICFYGKRSLRYLELCWILRSYLHFLS